MHTPAQAALAVDDRSAVGEARRMGARLAGSLGFSEAAAGALALVVTEAASNIVKHADHGEIILRAVQRGATGGIEVIVLDRGPGLANPGQALRDGHSTAGSPGTGLGAMKRMSAEFDIHSVPGKGAALRAVIWANPVSALTSEHLEVGVVCLPKSGESVCGDAWTIVPTAHGPLVCVVDGLGHGPGAAAAARAAIAAVEQNAEREHRVERLMGAMHLALRPTRGAAAAVALLQPDAALCSFCGVGNISAVLLSQGQSRSMVSHSGILGHQTRKIQELNYPLVDGALCILHSDGLATRWRLDDYPGLEGSHPSLIAGVLYRDFSRRRDDTTVVVVRRARRT